MLPRPQSRSETTVLDVKFARMIVLSDLRDRPHFQSVIADRVWRAWWQAGGTPLDLIASRVAENVGAAPIPSAFVAHDGDRFLGTVSVIASDLSARPHYTPWVAAVWVEHEARGAGLGAALVRHGAAVIFRAGWRRAYLAAAPHRRSFYEGLGWTVLEDGIGEDRMAVLTLEDAPGGAGQS
jgi:GNAT superfamily N-acetyltransferase